MALRRGRDSVIDRRLRELDQEMTKLSRRIKQVSKSGKPLQGTETPRRAPVRSALASVERAVPTPEKEVFKERNDEAMEKVSVARVAEHEAFPELGRDKFVNYFAAGFSGELRPVRQDKNVMRNKAIMMALLALIVGFALAYHFFFR